MFEPTGTIADIIPEARPHFDALLEEMERRGYSPRIMGMGAGRTCGQQNSINPANTGATGCQSWHVLGRALDIELRPWSCAAATEMGEWWEDRGGFWGGRWTQFGGCGDSGHFHWPEQEGQGSPRGCPSSPAACASYRQAYLEQAALWTAPLSPWWGVLAGAAVAGGFIAWQKLR